MLKDNYSQGRMTKAVDTNATYFSEWENYDDNLDSLTAFLKGEDGQYSSPYNILKEIINEKNGKSVVDNESSVIKYISDALKSKNIAFQRKTLENWIKGKSAPQGNENSKKLAFQIAFALDLNVRDCTNMISKMLFLRAFNFKKPDEIVFYYFIKNNLQYNDAVDFFESLDFSDGTKCDAKETRVVFDDIDNLNSLNELKSYLEINAEAFADQLVTAHRYYKQLLETSLKILGSDNVDNLLETIFGFDARSAKKDKTISKISKFAPYVKLNFPSSINFSKALNNTNLSEDIIRKAIILLHFYIFFADGAENEYGSFIGLEEYKSSINNILWDCGFSPLYSRNPYDVIFIICVVNSDEAITPLEMFQEIYGSMYLDYAFDDQFSEEQE